MLLQKNEYHLTLEKEAPKILKICPAINRTYVYITTCRQPADQERLVHIDSKGKILWEKAYKNSLDTFGMLSERDVIVLNVAQGQLEIIDLVNHTIRSTPHRFSFDDTSYMQIHTFYETRYLCVQQSGSVGDGKLILTYYRYGNSQLQQIAEYRSKQKEWLYGQSIAKANNHSKIVWWKSEYKGQIQFSFFDLRVNTEGALSKIKCRNTMGTMYNIQNISVCIGSLWESQPDKYTIVCNASNMFSGAFRKVVELDSVLGTIKRQPYEFESLKFRSFSVIDFINMGEFSVFFTQIMKQGKAEDSLIFYVSNETQKQITSQTWKATTKSHFYVPGYDKNMIVQAVHDNSNVKEVKVVVKRMMTVVEMYVHFMLHLNEDFDDDLLQDALEVMGHI